ncbi:GNAT family protein [Salinisphaera sp.]|uniref:GNAT family N-acetyltransferase n=1 Tax=Salinisphaera sp. TaxID=1914330 RepID=UPI002D786F7F|nr:GNAT family protein [Salinisphaera sp.]HET7315203.1 GNAT family protein [Salinisphaera sp.]
MSGDYCRLEPLDAARHAAPLIAAYHAGDDAPSWTYLAYGPFASAAAYSGWIRENARGGDPLFYAIVERRTDRPLGVAGYLRIQPADGTLEIGHIHYADALKQTRAATEAIVLMMKHAFELGYRRVEWKCDALNAASRRAAERLGFVFEGVFRQATTYKQRNRDTAWYSVIDTEWPRLNACFQAWLDPANFDADGHQRRKLSTLTQRPDVQTGTGE